MWEKIIGVKEPGIRIQSLKNHLYFYSAHQLSHRARDIHILFTAHNGLTLTMYFAAQGNEMKIQKVFEAFEQFHLGEETLNQLVTQLEASLMQVTT